MIIRKAFKFRAYPSAEQVARLDAWDSALRFLWNLANEQRLLGLARHCVYRVDPPKVAGKERDEEDDEKPKRTRKAAGAVDERIFVNVFDQIRQLTALRAELSWLADVPVDVCQRLLADLDEAWQRCFKGLAAQPRWKRKGRSVLSFCEPHPAKWSLDGTTLHFPKLGTMRVVVHRPLEGAPKTCRLVRDVDQWFAVITCEVEVADPPKHDGPPVGIDRGVVNLVALSTGEVIENPRTLAAAKKRLVRAERTVDRRKKGSKNQKKARERVAKIHRRIRRQRDHVLHVVSSRIAKNHGLIGIEALKLKNMTKSAKGSVKKPGARVAQKRGLNRSILDAGLGRFATMLRYKSAWRGGRVVDVVAAYSSLECNRCGCTDKRNRPTQARFECIGCGLVEHADVNAGKVIEKRMLQALAVEPTVTGCGGSGTSRPARQQLRVVRRGTRAARTG